MIPVCVCPYAVLILAERCLSVASCSQQRRLCLAAPWSKYTWLQSRDFSLLYQQLFTSSSLLTQLVRLERHALTGGLDGRVTPLFSIVHRATSADVLSRFSHLC